MRTFLFFSFKFILVTQPYKAAFYHNVKKHNDTAHLPNNGKIVLKNEKKKNEKSNI